MFSNNEDKFGNQVDVLVNSIIMIVTCFHGNLMLHALHTSSTIVVLTVVTYETKLAVCMITTADCITY